MRAAFSSIRRWRIIRSSIFLRNESGNALIELALSLTVLTAMILGTAEGAYLAYAAIEVSNAAHAGATYGSQDHATADDTAGMQTAATNDAPNVSGLSATALRFCKCSGAGNSTCSVNDCSGSRIIEYVQVSTSASVTPPIRIPGSPSSYTFTGKAVMRVVQ